MYVFFVDNEPGSGGKYITPARRQPSTSSNSGGIPGKQHMNSGKYNRKLKLYIVLNELLIISITFN